MRHHARASAAAGSNKAAGASRGRLKSALAALALAMVALALGAGPASASPPVVTIGAVSDVLGTSAHITGEVDPADRFTYWSYQYSTDGVSWSPFSFEGEYRGEIAADSGGQPTPGILTGLQPATKYFVRLAAANFDDSFPNESEVVSSNLEFETTAVAKPTVAVNGATDLANTTAQVSGSITRPSGADPALDVGCRFEFISTAAYGPSTERQRLQITATGGTFTLAFADPESAPAQTTSPLAFNASADSVQTALESLANIGPGAIDVAGGGGIYAVDFTGPLANRNVAEITIDPSALTGPGGASVATTTRGFGGQNEVQQLTVEAVAGSFIVQLAGTATETAESTAPIAFDATAEAVQGALVALPNISPGDLVVSGGPGGYTITFEGALGSRDIPQLGVDRGALVGVGQAATTIVTPGHLEGFEGAAEARCNIDPVTAPGTSTVNATLGGLRANTTYHLRLIGSNAGGSDSQEASNFTTAARIKAQTLGAGEVQDDSATLAGRINPANSPVVYQFEWGLDETYGQKAFPSPELLGVADETFHPVAGPIPGLSPETTYHYRVVATNTETGEVAPGADLTFTTLRAAKAPGACPNEGSRLGFSSGLPDCRAYELATPGLNNSAPSAWPEVFGLAVRADGDAFSFISADASNEAEGSNAITNRFLGRKAAVGWLPVKALSPPTPLATGAYQGASASTLAVSSDFNQSVLWTQQPLLGDASPAGTNLYLRRADGSFAALTTAGIPAFREGSGLFAGASQDFSHIFIAPCARQLEADPVVYVQPFQGCPGNLYEWVDGKLGLVTILPGEGEKPAPSGGAIAQGVMPSISDDGQRVLFTIADEAGLFLRVDGQETIEVSASQRDIDPDLNPTAPARSVGITADGSTVLFTSPSELTNDANTGEVEGVASDQGNDLYSYDVESGELTDLTVDDDPADALTGAKVERVYGASSDASFVYFTAASVLAPGALAGESNLYVEHEGVITFVAPATEGLFEERGNPSLYVTPDGRHAAFPSKSSLTGYDSAGAIEIYKFTYGDGLECVSCRPSGEPPVASASYLGRALSDDGSRAFFQSKDAILPAAQSGLNNIYEYEDGAVHLLTPGAGLPSVLVGASASGDDVFVATHQELSPQGQGEVFAIYDVRVNADVPLAPALPQCQGENCRGAASSAPNLPGTATATFDAPGKVSLDAPRSVRGSKASLRVIVPTVGQLKIFGKGLKPVTASASKAGSATLTIALKAAADKTRKRQGAFRTKVEVLFESSAGDASRAELTLKFEASTKKKGGK